MKNKASELVLVVLFWIECYFLFFQAFTIRHSHGLDGFWLQLSNTLERPNDLY